MLTNPRIVLIQECEPWRGYEAAHCTWAAGFAHATGVVPPYVIYVPLDDPVPPPHAPEL